MNTFFETEHPVSFYHFQDVLALRMANAKQFSSQILATCYFHENDFPLYMHAHSFYEINVITKGEGIHYIGENSIPTKSGDVFVIPPNFKHGYEDTKNLVIFHIVLSNAFLEKYSNLLKDIY
ncbi:MAG: AraC family ligand binding domain-containing protein, partial [Clostridia bacterium]|nr:AraC family ligand binding domain-containing protein [Clostridia bacterium]